MINIAGHKDADAHIQEELLLAGIPMHKGMKSRSEVSSFITGWLGGWIFERAPVYWMAHAQPGKGLILEYAFVLHKTKYPVIGEGQPEIYGQVVRVDGNGECPPPEKMAKHYDSLDRLLILDPDGEDEESLKLSIEAGITRKEELDACHYVQNAKDLERLTRISLIDHYHVDTQLGLNELAKAIKGNVRY
jgi:gamma-glutamylcyclotransferase (GGCT)/AIG2-like uncharacterized protein YtfP